jgi:phosphoribosylaminoimidazolecarboxamide formyltransferase / IMP cyclohydrolase
MKKIKSALISVFYKDGLEKIVKQLDDLGVTIYSTGGTQQFIEKLNISCVPVETLTSYPSILGGRVKTLHPSVFGAILGKRDDETHLLEMKEFEIPEIDLVIVDLYPFEETVRSTTDEALIIEKIDIGGPSMIRAAAKNHRDVLIVAAKKDYALLEEILSHHQGETTLEQRRFFAIRAFDVCTGYDNAISNYFHQTDFSVPFNNEEKSLRYGENPHQSASFFGDLKKIFTQLHGKELSYNNLVDVDAAIQLIKEFDVASNNNEFVFAIIKHTNVCGISVRSTLNAAWNDALAGDPESAFGGVLVCNGAVDATTASAINELFFEVLIAGSFNEDALTILKSKKNRILLQLRNVDLAKHQSRSLLNGMLTQQVDTGNYIEWKEAFEK